MKGYIRQHGRPVLPPESTLTASIFNDFFFTEARFLKAFGQWQCVEAGEPIQWLKGKSASECKAALLRLGCHWKWDEPDFEQAHRRQFSSPERLGDRDRTGTIHSRDFPDIRPAGATVSDSLGTGIPLDKRSCSRPGEEMASSR